MMKSETVKGMHLQCMGGSKCKELIRQQVSRERAETNGELVAA